MGLGLSKDADNPNPSDSDSCTGSGTYVKKKICYHYEYCNLQQRYCSIKGSTCTLHHDIPETYCVRLFAGVRACNNTWA